MRGHVRERCKGNWYAVLSIRDPQTGKRKVTHLLAAGVHPKIAQERLGHSSVGITLDLYSHVLPGMQEDAVAKVDAALQAAINKRETSASKALAKPDFRGSGEKEKL